MLSRGTNTPVSFTTPIQAPPHPPHQPSRRISRLPTAAQMDPTYNHHSPRKRRRIASPTSSRRSRAVEAEATACVICQEAISEKAVAGPCGHEYDYICILTWAGVKPLCPLCKVAIEWLEVGGVKVSFYGPWFSGRRMPWTNSDPA